MAKRTELARPRKLLGYNQERFAERLGVERTTLARWERGGRPRGRPPGNA